jgi:hypothetical protein
LKTWLPELLEGGTSNTFVEILNDLDVAEFHSLKLLSGKESGLSFDPLKGDQDGVGIEVRRVEGGDGTVAIRLKGRKLEVRTSLKSDDDLLSRLQFAVLQIDSLVGRGPSLRIVFTPALPALGLAHSGLNHDLRSTPAMAFFAATYDFQKPLTARVKIDRLSLSILPGDNPGWRFPAPENGTLKDPLEAPLELSYARDRKWSAVLKVSTNFGKEDVRDLGEEDSPIHAELTSPSLTGPPPVSEAALAGAGAVAEGNDGGKAKGQQTKPFSSSKNKNPPKVGKAKTAKPLEEIGADERARLDDGTLLLELFRRYGRVHGSIVVTVNSGESDEEVAVLRFGDPSSNHPTPPTDQVIVDGQRSRTIQPSGVP